MYLVVLPYRIESTIIYYGNKQLQSPFGIAVDGKVYSLVGEYRYCGQLKIFSPEGKLIHSVGNL